MASKIAAFEHLLGTMPDAKIAEMADVKPETVARYRKEKGIAEFDPDAEEIPAEKEPAEDDDDLPGLIASATEFLESQGYTVTKAGTEVDKAPKNVKVKATAQLHRPEGGSAMRVSRGDVFGGAIAAWLWEHHRDAVKPYPPKG